MLDNLENTNEEKAIEEGKLLNAKENARNLFKIGISYEVVRASITILSNEEIFSIYNEVMNSGCAGYKECSVQYQSYAVEDYHKRLNTLNRNKKEYLAKVGELALQGKMDSPQYKELISGYRKMISLIEEEENYLKK